MIDETTPTPSGMDVDPLDQMADILTDAPEEEAQPSNKKTDTETDAGAKDLDEETDAPTADDDDPVDDDAQVDDDDAPTDKDEDEDEDDRTLSQLMGLADDQVSVNEETGVMSIKTKVDGVEATVGLKDVLAGYQTSKYNTQKSMALADDRKVFEEAAGKRAVEIKQTLELNHALTKQLQGELMREFQSTNWDELRQQDPAEYAARQQDQSVRYNQLQQVQQQVEQQQGQSDQDQQQKVTEQYHSDLMKQKDIMLANNPTWHDQAVMKTEVAGIRDFLTGTYGLSEAEVGMIGDAKAIQIIQDAMAYRSKSPVAKKKLAAVPKMQKSKGVKRKKVSKLDKLTIAARGASGSQKRDLQTDAIAELLSGG